MNLALFSDRNRIAAVAHVIQLLIVQAISGMDCGALIAEWRPCETGTRSDHELSVVFGVDGFSHYWLGLQYVIGVRNEIRRQALRRVPAVVELVPYAQCECKAGRRLARPFDSIWPSNRGRPPGSAHRERSPGCPNRSRATCL